MPVPFLRVSELLWSCTFSFLACSSWLCGWPAARIPPPGNRLKRLHPLNPILDVSSRETHWVHRQLASKLISQSTSTSRPFLLLRTDGVAEGNGSCNRFRGKFFTNTPGELKFSPLKSTRMACPAMAIETDFNIALAQTSNFRITDGILRRLDAIGATLTRLEAVHLRLPLPIPV